VEDVLTYHKQRMKTDTSGHALQLLVGRCVHSEHNGLPQIRKEQVGASMYVYMYVYMCT